MTDNPLILALDFGGTKLAAAVARAEAGDQVNWLGRCQQNMPPTARADFHISAMLVLARQLLRQYSTPLAAIGVSFGGPVDPQTGMVRTSFHTAGWRDLPPLRQVLQSELGAPVTLDNDANAGALGEWRYGAGRGCATLLYVTISTGVGSGWIINRELYHGANGLAGEIGHVLIDPNGPVCGCGRRGCLEALACGPAIARAARDRLLAEPNAGARLRQAVSNDLGALTAEHISRAASEGDELAQAVLLEAARALGIGLGHALSLMNPDRVVLGGGVTKAGGRYLAAVQHTVRANTLPEMTAEIVLAALGDDAPLWGAYTLARQVALAGNQYA